jgi:hypothetical protein
VTTAGVVGDAAAVGPTLGAVVGGLGDGVVETVHPASARIPSARTGVRSLFGSLTFGSSLNNLEQGWSARRDADPRRGTVSQRSMVGKALAPTARAARHPWRTLDA